ncbi:MAG: hypothetical protein CSA70_00005 [Rhodobacterales bacterium]|nr:MAG: hypothetical protein CSA70_00005 [Rhodobacterales bacterium]
MQGSKTAKKIRNLVKSDQVAHAFLGWLSTYSNWIDELSVSAAVKATIKWAKKNMDAPPVVNRSEIIRVMKTLEECAVGQFWVGRRGAESRFEFWVHRGQLGKAGMGEVKSLEIEEDAEELAQDDLLEMHRRLIAHALEKPLSAIRIKIREDV